MRRNAKIGGDEIGRGVMQSNGSSPAILMKWQGVFTIGKSPEEAVKAAEMVEVVARTMSFALQRGEPGKFPPKRSNVPISDIFKNTDRHNRRVPQRSSGP